MNQQELDIEQSLNYIINEKLKHANTFKMGIITDVYMPFISVKPLGQETLYDESSKEYYNVEFPIINNVPVTFYTFGDFIITMPIKKGDRVSLLFSDLSLDEFLDGTGKDNFVIGDIRYKDISDAVAIPSFTTKTDWINNYDVDSLQIRDKSGTNIIQIKNNEIALKTNKTVIGGLSGSTAIAKANECNTNFNNIKTWINTIAIPILTTFGAPPTLIITNNVDSTKAFTND